MRWRYNTMSQMTKKALKAKRESKYVEFKETFDPSQPRDWCEIIKDIVALANSGGGIILVGVNNKGVPTGFDPEVLLQIDPAVVTDRIHKYTGIQFSDCEIIAEAKAGHRVAAILVHSVPIPIVCVKPGTYRIGPKAQKTAFSSGTVYFRHGAKSEPGTSDDIRSAIERYVESLRKSWMSGVRKVVQAPPDSKVYTFPAHVEVRESSSPDARAIRIIDDPSVPAYRKIDYDITHPYRQKEVIETANQALAGKATINQYDIKCVKQLYKIEGQEAFCHRPKFSPSPQYTQRFVDWLIREFGKDNNFFVNLRQRAYERRSY